MDIEKMCIVYRNKATYYLALFYTLLVITTNNGRNIVTSFVTRIEFIVYSYNFCMGFYLSMYLDAVMSREVLSTTT